MNILSKGRSHPAQCDVAEPICASHAPLDTKAARALIRTEPSTTMMAPPDRLTMLRAVRVQTN
jgi:hypothetical protein